MTHRLFRTALVLLVLALTAGSGAGQDQTNSTPPPASGPQAVANDTGAQTNADETFELNIAERRITERDFEASTAVEAGDESARGLRLRVGVAVGASTIDVLLRNVRGSVRFRASLERVLERINARRTTRSSP